MEKTKEYPEPICQMCSKKCKTWEEVDTVGGNEIGFSRIELWCYCEECKVDSFHPIPSDNNHYPE